MTDALLSIQLIVRNEETLLPFCLDSVKTIADEIVVVDTGSTDRSVEIARSYGAKVIVSKWNDDFSYARNQGLAHTQAQWIFYIDADEVLTEGKESLRERLTATNAEAFWVNIENVLGRLPEERLQHRMIRLFRNNPSYRFRERIHEQIIPSILERCTPDRLELSHLKLTHLGYFAEIKNQSEKRERNERILALMLNESNQDPFVLYNLGIAKEQRGDTQEALKDLLSAKTSAPAAAAYRPGLIRDIAKLHLTLDRPDEAARMLNEECGNYQDYPDLYFLLGRSYRLQGLYPEALQAFQKAAGCQPSSAPYAIETGTATFRAYTELGELLAKLGQYESAKTCYEKALEFHAGYMPALLGWTAALDALNVSIDTIAAGLQQLLAKLPDRAKKYAEAMIYLGRFEELIGTHNDERDPAEPELEYLTALAHLHLKQYDQAVLILQNLSATVLPDRRTDIAQTLALATWSRGSALGYEFYWELDADVRRLYRSLERRLWKRPKEAMDPAMLQMAREMIGKAVQNGLLDTASGLAGSDPALLMHAAKCLYHSGYVQLAADLFIHLLEGDSLDAEATAFLAEILYDRAHYGEAAALFEQAVPESGDAARIGAVLSYLQTSRSLLQQALESTPDSSLLKGEMQKTTTGIELLSKIGWRTEWTPAQRRSAGVVTPDFLMHDRER